LQKRPQEGYLLPRARALDCQGFVGCGSIMVDRCRRCGALVDDLDSRLIPDRVAAKARLPWKHSINRGGSDFDIHSNFAAVFA
jgi:hypothetical protein